MIRIKQFRFFRSTDRRNALTTGGIAQQAEDWGLIFRTRNGTPHTAQNIRNALKRIMKDTNFSGLTTHDLRKIYTTVLVNAGTPVSVVQSNLGHSRPDTTLRFYIKVLKESKLASAKVIDTKFGVPKIPVAAEIAKPVRPIGKKFAFPIYGRRFKKKTSRGEKA